MSEKEKDNFYEKCGEIRKIPGSCPLLDSPRVKIYLPM
jgi:hypothetical protein